MAIFEDQHGTDKQKSQTQNFKNAVALERRVDVTKLNLLVIKLYLATVLPKITGSLIV